MNKKYKIQNLVDPHNWLRLNNFYVATANYVRNNSDPMTLHFELWSDSFKGGIAYVDGKQLTKKRVKLKTLRWLMATGYYVGVKRALEFSVKWRLNETK